MGSRWTLPLIAATARSDKAALKGIKEAGFSKAIVLWAKLNGWQAHYERQSGYKGADGEWRGSGPKGKPDLTLAKEGRVLLAELKTETGTPSAEQREWLAALGPYGRLWRPRDAETVMEELS